VRLAKLAALPRGDSGRMRSMTPPPRSPCGSLQVCARRPYGRRARLAARGRPAAPDGPAPDLEIGFPRRSIEHASNSPRKLRAIEHASRYPPSARSLRQSGGGENTEVAEATTFDRPLRGQGLGYGRADTPHVSRAQNRDGQGNRFAAATPALTARKGAHAWNASAPGECRPVSPGEWQSQQGGAGTTQMRTSLDINHNH
jgi:hypothetical protein